MGKRAFKGLLLIPNFECYYEFLSEKHVESIYAMVDGRMKNFFKNSIFCGKNDKKIK
jgi:hypothetical protein